MTRAGILLVLIGGMMALLPMRRGGAATAQSTADAYFHEAARST
jgi:hypothetical protein